MDFKIGQMVIINTDDYAYLNDRGIENGSIGIIDHIAPNPREKYRFHVSVGDASGTFTEKELNPCDLKATII